MARFSFTQSYFRFGEVSPTLRGNIAFDGYNDCLERCENFIPAHTGGLLKRTGTKFVAEVGGANSVLFPFIFSETESYILEFTEYFHPIQNTRISFYNKRGLCKYNDAGGTEDMVIYFIGLTANQLKRMRLIKHGDVLLISSPRGIFVLYKQTVFSDDGRTSWFRWEIKPDTSNVLSSLKFTMPPMDLTNGNTEKGFKFKKEGGFWLFYPVDYEAYRNAVDKTWDNIPKPKREYFKDFHTDTNIDAHQMFFFTVQKEDGVLQRYWFKITDGTAPDVTADDWGYIKATLDIVHSPDNGDWLLSGDKGKAPFYKYAFEAFGYEIGFIDSSTMFGGRLVIGKNQSLYASSLTDFLDFEDGTEDTDAVKVQVNLNEENVIKWVIGTDKLFIGTSSAIYVQGDTSTVSPPITPKNFEIKMLSPATANDLQPIVTQAGVLFANKYGDRLNELYLENDSQTYKVKDRSLTGSHLTASGIVSHCFMREPYNTYFAACKDGTLAAMTYLPENSFSAWYRIKLGGNAKVRVVTTFSSDVSENLFMIVERVIQGQTKYYLEYITNPYEVGAQEEYKQYFVDGGKTFKSNLIVNSMTAPKDFITVNTNSLDRTKAGHKLLLFVNRDDYFISDICEIRPTGVRIIPKQNAFEKRGSACFKIGDISSIVINNILVTFNIADLKIILASDSKVIFHNSGLLLNEVSIDNRLWNIFSPLSNSSFSVNFRGLTGDLNPDAECYLFISNLTFSYSPLMITVEGAHRAETMFTFRDCVGDDAAVFANKTFDVIRADFIAPNNTTDIYLDAGELALQDAVENRQIRLDSFEVTVRLNVLDGLNHLEGETVDVLADGEIIKNQVVINGQITLPASVFYAVAGYRYKAVFQTLPYFGGKMTGSSVGSASSYRSMHMRLHYSFGGKYGTSPKTMYPIAESSFTPIGINESVGEKRVLRSGDLILNAPNDCLRSKTMRVEHDDPCNFNVQAYGATIDVEEG